MQQIMPGIWKISLGESETDTPMHFLPRIPKYEALNRLPKVTDCPIREQDIVYRQMKRGFHVELPLAETEQIYGLGLQLLSFNQRTKKKTLRVNADPCVDLGDSHAPVPFYLSTAGYGVLVDTARYATFYFSPVVPKTLLSETIESQRQKGQSYDPKNTYKWGSEDRNGPVLIDIPASAGVDLYIFAGPQLRDAVQRYNLFSGGGCLPPRWGLGIWYRVKFTHNQEQTTAAAQNLRMDGIPCDVIGLEPGWQSHTYPCSHTWNDSFPDPSQLVNCLRELNYRVNLWTHVFTHNSSPIYEALYPYSGNFTVLGGLVPDLLLPQTANILAEHYLCEHVVRGVSGYKLDECDNNDFNRIYWSFPESSEFPSGIDGEVMHTLLGVKFQEIIEGIYRCRNQRTYGNVRSSYALASPYPFVLYSDLYDAKEFIRGLVNSGFSGLLWTPEVRDAASEEDLIRRLQVVVLSPQATIDAWFIHNPPWKQWRKAENNRGEFVENWIDLEAACRHILELRMQLIPYLYTAFYHYYQEGLPPFRALVMDYPQDPQVYGIDNQWMIGDRLLAAPVIAGEHRRSIYLPTGDWYDFWTGQGIEGGRSFDMEVPLDCIPLFVKNGAVLPLAQPTIHTEDPSCFSLKVKIYGDGSLPCTLIEDDGFSLDFEKGMMNQVKLSWNQENQVGMFVRAGEYSAPHYTVISWERIQC